MRCHLILNPRSRGGKAARKFNTIFRLMDRAGIVYDTAMTDSYDSIRDASIQAQSGEYDSIVAVGGDGTINAVINGFFDESGLPRSDNKMGVIYTGTSPDFCKSYGISLGLDQAVEDIRLGHVCPVRLGRISFKKEEGAEGMESRYFSCCASIGIGAMVAAKANRNRKYLGDTAGTLAAILSSLVSFRPVEMSLKMNGDELSIPAVTNIFVGRSKFIASGLRVKYGMDDGDDRFYILCARDLNLIRLPGLLRQLYSGRIEDSRTLKVFYSNFMEINAVGRSIPVEFDGDPAGFTPCTIEAAVSPLRLIVGNNI